MASIYELQVKRNKYYNLRDNINNITFNLKSGCGNLQKVTSKFGEYFSIDSVPADNNRSANICNNIIEIQNTLNNTIMPAINSEIKKINEEIRMLEAVEG